MKFLPFCLIFLSLIVCNAFSEEGITTTQDSEKTEMSKESSKAQTQSSREENTSLNNRQNKKYQLSVGVGNEYSFAAFTLTAGYFIDPSQVITLRYSRITQDIESEAVSNELHKIRAYTLGYRKFLGNSFNIQPTMYYRKSSTDYVNEGAVKSVGTPNLTYDDFGVGFKIGNEWQWKNFVLGIDWIGLNKTIYKINSQKTWQGAPQATHFKEETTFTLVSLYLGASF